MEKNIGSELKQEVEIISAHCYVAIGRVLVCTNDYTSQVHQNLALYF